MKFVHIADMHFDAPFSLLSTKEEIGDIRRLDQRNTFNKIINYIRENKIEYFFIAGDLYEHEYIRQSTIEYINNKFKEIEDTKIYISPGNHDPYLKNSYYANYKWNKNVKIFSSEEFEKIENQDFILYGNAFNNFNLENSKIPEIIIENKEKINILLTHADLDSGVSVYNSISSSKLKQIGFDYVALGHIHKNNISENNNIIYPGSTISLGFDELGKHGMVAGEIIKENNETKLKIEFIPVDEKEFIEKEINITQIYTQEELVEEINKIQIPENNYAKIILTGKRNFEINIYQIIKLVEQKNIIKIKNQTEINYSLEEIKNTTTLKGIFVEEMLRKLKEAKTQEEKEIIEKAIEIGMEVLM